MQIRGLEKGRAAALGDRRPGATALGVEIARRASDILSAVRDLADCARRANGFLTGTWRLGVIPTLALYVRPRVLPAQARRFRRLRLDLQEAQIRVLLQELIRGTLDAMLLAPPVEPPALETLPLFDDRFLLALPAEDPLPEHGRVSAGDANARRLILPEEGHCLRDQARAYCARPPGPPARRPGYAPPALPRPCRWWPAVTE
jgi:LysR family transcriptional regulator, hydrogen peroxide-inducible genes activator